MGKRKHVEKCTQEYLYERVKAEGSSFLSFANPSSPFTKMWLLPLLLLSSSFAAADTRACYFPDGTKALDRVPCSDQSNTACCGSDHICMANGLCLNSGSHQPFGFSRAACTDSNWGADCPHVCVSCGSYP